MLTAKRYHNVTRHPNSPLTNHVTRSIWTNQIYLLVFVGLVFQGFFDLQWQIEAPGKVKEKLREKGKKYTLTKKVCIKAFIYHLRKELRAKKIYTKLCSHVHLKPYFSYDVAICILKKYRRWASDRQLILYHNMGSWVLCCSMEHQVTATRAA